MVARFFRDASLFSLVSFAEKGVALVTFPLLASQLSPAEYGLFDLTCIAVSIASLGAGLELYQGVMRQLPDAKSDRERGELLSTAMVSVIVMAVIICLLALPFWKSISSLVYAEPGQAKLLCLGAALLIANCMSSLLYVTLRAQLRMRVLVRVAILRLAVQTSAALWLVLGAHWKAEGLICAQITGAALVVVACWRACGNLLHLTWNRQAFMKLFAFSGPLLAGSLCVILSQQGDRAAVRALLTIADVGVLGTGYRVAAVVGLVTSGVEMALSPLIYQYYTRGETPAQIARMLRIYLGLCFLLCLGLALFAGPLLQRFTPPAYHAAAATVPILGATLMLGHLPSFFPGLAIANRTKTMALIQISGLAVNLCGFILLGGLFGLMGICFSGLMTQLYVLIVSARLSHRHYPIPLPWLELAVFSGIAAGVVTLWIAYLPHTLLAGIPIVAAGVALVFLFRLISVHDVRQALLRITAARAARSAGRS